MLATAEAQAARRTPRTSPNLLADHAQQHIDLVAEDLRGLESAGPVVPVSYKRPMNMPWCDSPFLEAQIAAEGLPPRLAAIARKFARDGYVIIDPGFSDELVARTIQDMDGRYHTGGGGAYADNGRIQDSWLFSDHSRQIATDPKVLDFLYFLYRRQPFAFQTLNFPAGTQQRTHSDTIHFHCFPHHFMCGVWVALEDIDLGNGPLHYYPGSQRLPVYDMQDLGFTASRQSQPYEYYKHYEDFVEGLARTHGLERRELKVKKGQALVWAANLFHGGSPILEAGRSRHSQVTHYYFTDCVYTTPLLSDFKAGRAFVREPRNIKNDNPVTPRYNGVAVPGAGWPFDLRQAPADPLAAGTPVPLNTDRPQRVVAWPRWDDPGDLQRMLRDFGPVLGGREDVCLCLRLDPATDPPLAAALQTFIAAYNEALGSESFDVLFVEDDLAQIDWPRLGKSATCALRAGGPWPGAQHDFVAALGVPVLATAAELQARLDAPPAATQP